MEELEVLSVLFSGLAFVMSFYALMLNRKVRKDVKDLQSKSTWRIVCRGDHKDERQKAY